MRLHQTETETPPFSVWRWRQTLAEFLVLVKEDPHALSDAWSAARARGAAWCEALDTALAKLPAVAAQLIPPGRSG